mmetsp:Transcript_19573/g.27322  ORF Transcript_19573/g.27322 Transcript_19573/m.27322 type:complete len:206 (-) Transcript_19573:1995-2612(-)
MKAMSTRKAASPVKFSGSAWIMQSINVARRSSAEKASMCNLKGISMQASHKCSSFPCKVVASKNLRIDWIPDWSLTEISFQASKGVIVTFGGGGAHVVGAGGISALTGVKPTLGVGDEGADVLSPLDFMWNLVDLIRKPLPSISLSSISAASRAFASLFAAAVCTVVSATNVLCSLMSSARGKSRNLVSSSTPRASLAPFCEEVC